jgi:hypothetical protein
MSTEKTDSLVERLRNSYLAGNSIGELIGGEPRFREASPLEIMWMMMETFHLGLSDVSCIDGWWPPGSNREVTDENLDLFIRDAIEKHRSAWDPIKG